MCVGTEIKCRAEEGKFEDQLRSWLTGFQTAASAKAERPQPPADDADVKAALRTAEGLLGCLAGVAQLCSGSSCLTGHSRKALLPDIGQPLATWGQHLLECYRTSRVMREEAKAVDEAAKGFVTILLRQTSQSPDPAAARVDLRRVVSRIARHFQCSAECFILALVYIDRACRRGVHLHVWSLSRLVATSLVLAVKFNDDHYYSNRFYAQVIGLTLHELNSLEIDLLRLLRCTLFVPTEVFLKYRGMIHEASADALS